MRTVRDSLREAELSVWTDEGLEPGTPAWANAIEDAIGQAQALVVLLSPDAKASAWVGKEVTYAQAMGKRVFTALVAGDTPVGAVPINLDRRAVGGRVAGPAPGQSRKNCGRRSCAICIDLRWPCRRLSLIG